MASEGSSCLDLKWSGSSAKFITANSNIRFKTSGVSLANDGTTTIDTGSTGAGNVSFAATNSTGISIEANDATSFDDLLVITSGTGDVSFAGTIGATNALGGLTINSSAGDGDITFTSTIGDSGNPGIVGTTSIGGTSTENIHFDAAIYSFDGGITTITATTGSNGSGETIEVASTTEFIAAGEAIKFVGGKIDLADNANLTITSGNGAVEVSGVAGDSDETVTINAGTTGAITLNTTNTALSGTSSNLVLAFAGTVTTHTGAVTITNADYTTAELKIINAAS